MCLLTQFCVYYTIPGTNIALNRNMARVRENVVAVDVENDGRLCMSESDVEIENCFPAGVARRRPSATTSRTLRTKHAAEGGI
jgi:hypothetical protein